MNRLIKLLTTTLCCAVGVLPMFAGENTQDTPKWSKMTITQTCSTIEFDINWANDKGNDSYTKGNMTFKCGSSEWTVGIFAGDKAKDKYSSLSYYGLSSDKSKSLKIESCYKSGSDYWAKCKITFIGSYYHGQEFSVGYSCTYVENRDDDVQTSHSSTAKVDIDAAYEMCSNHVSVVSTGSKKFNINVNNHDKATGTYEFYAITENKAVSEMISPTSSISVGNISKSGSGTTTFSLPITTTSDYNPTLYYHRYTYKHNDQNIKIYDSTSGAIASPHFMRAKDLKASVSDQWYNKVTLNWNTERYDIVAGISGWWVITRKPKSGGTQEFLKSFKSTTIKNTQCTTDAITNTQNDYTYKVSFVPEAWGQPTSSNYSSLISDDLSKTVDITFGLDYRFTSLTISDNASGNGFDINWSSTTIGNDNSYAFEIYRYSETEGVSKAQKVGTVNVKKSDGTNHTFNDNTITDRTQSYTYFIRVSINSNDYESEEKTWFSEVHNGITSFKATTGEYNNLVNLNWTARRADDAVTYYELYRKKESQNDSYYKLIASLSGTDATFAYTDNGVNAGDIYSYKLVSYVQKKSDGSRYGDESMVVMGFASQSAVISGSVTFETGTATDSVRVRLEKIDEDANPYHSLKIDGPGSGINWAPEGNKLIDVFSAENNSWTVQTFISPDSMNHDGRFMQLGDVTLSLGNLSEGYYNLYVNKNYDWVNAQTLQNEGRLQKSVYFTQIRYKTRKYGAQTSGTYYYVYFTDGTLFTPYDGHIKKDGQFIRSYYPTCSSDGWVYYTFDSPVMVDHWQKNVVLSDFELLVPVTGVTELVNNVKIPAGKYSSLNIAYSGSTLTVTDIEDENNTLVTQGSIDRPISFAEGGFSVGSVGTDDANKSFTGYIDELRIFSGQTLDQKSILSNYDRYLSGNEKGLVAYWKLDEGITNQNKAYDCSLTDGTPNSNHADIIGVNYRMEDNIVPSNLSYYALTDNLGSYVIRGIPYVATGTNYVVRPTKGTHEFSPVTRTRFINANANTFNSTDFTDVSSFPVKGVVYYSGTTYPVEDCMLYVDGLPSSKDGETVMTDENGEFEISVPIGEHYIQIKKDGHNFASGGRYPAKGLVDIRQEINNLTFSDSTLVVIAGRVCGGESENSEPLGMGRSKNNIGQAEIVLSTEYMTGKSGMLNAKAVVNGNTVTYEPADTIRTFVGDMNSKSPTDAYVAGSTQDSTKIIKITTDRYTGEFCAKLPPLRYMVKSVRIINNKDDITYDNISDIDATDALAEITDSLISDASTSYYTYNVKMDVPEYHSPADFFITQKNKPEGVFGNDTLKLEHDVLKFYEVGKDKVTYTYGYPIYTMYDNYTYKVKVQEEYHNYDYAEKVDTTIYPLAGTNVVFSNQMSADEYGFSTDSLKMVELQHHTLVLDSVGQGTYEFTAGFPNIEESAGYKLAMDITYNVDGSYKSWECPYFTDGKFYGIVLGSIPMGNDFITAGPDEVEMVLRDPPGSKSFTTWQENTSVSTTWSVVNESSTHNDSYVGLNTGGTIETAIGVGCLVINTIENHASSGISITRDQSNSSSTSVTKRITATSAVSTSDEACWDGPDADVFIGTSNNTTIGQVRDVNFHWSGSKYELNMKQMTSLGTTFNTTFNYTRYYIEETVIPQFQQLIKEMEEERAIPGHEKKGIYTQTDASDNVVEFDSLRYYETQIENWEKQLARDEYSKVSAAANQTDYLIDNYSFDSGTKISNTIDYSNTETRGTEKYTNLSTGLIINGGVTINGIGVESEHQMTWSDATTTSAELEVTKDASFEYTFAESSTFDALSVDVYKAPDKMSPIFRTRGGRTSGFHEEQKMTKLLTKYYPNEYSAEQEIMSSTKKVFVPKIRVEQTEIVNIPNGSSANVKFTISNESESESYGYFTFKDLTRTNKDNLTIIADGTDLNNGLTYLLEYNKPLVITTSMSQTNIDVKDYSIVMGLLDNTQNQRQGTFDMNIDTVRINLHFVAASCPIQLATSTPYYNKADSNVVFTFSGYDLNMKYLKKIGLEYKLPGARDWYREKEWSKDDIENAEFKYKKEMGSTYVDGTYTFRAFTKSEFDGQAVYAYSDELSFTKDTSAPQTLGNTNPYNDVYGVGSEVSVSFNEDIVQGNISNNDVTLRGILDDGNDNVSVYFNGDEGTETQSKIKQLTGNSTISMWLKRNNKNATGTIWKRESGNVTSVDVDTAGYLYLKRDAIVIKSTDTIPFDKWVFLNICLKNSDNNKYIGEVTFLPEGSSKLNPDTLLNVEMEQFALATGKIIFGENFVGSMKRISIWDAPFDYFQSQANDKKTKTQFTPNLVAYWPMNEGSGTIINEVVNANNIILNSKNDWIIDRDNYSLSLSKSQLAQTDLSKIVTEKDEDYSAQFWFRANKEQGNFGQLIGFSADGMTYGTRIGLDHSSGKLQLRDGNNVVGDISSDNYLDDKWHRFAMTVSKSNNGNATFYIDGTARYSTSAASISNLIGLMYMGGDFYGNIDEFRIWKRNLSADEIDGNMHKELNTDIDDVALYLPFNKDSIDQYMQSIPVFTPGELTLVVGNPLTGSKTIAPPVKSADVLSDVAFDLVKSERKIQFKIKDTEETKIQGRHLYATVTNVKDFAGNVADPIKWEFDVSLDKVHWGNDNFNAGGDDIKDKTYILTVVNNTNVEQSWTIKNIPNWMVLSRETGTTSAYGSTILNVTFLDNMPQGSNSGYLYLCENTTSFSSALPYDLCLTYNSPDWTVDSHKYKSMMSVTGQVIINDIKQTNVYSKLAAFNEKDECVGIASPTYYDRTDGYYLSLTVYGNETSTTPLKFRYYEASQGIIYANVKGTTEVTFTPFGMIGSYTDPYIWKDDNNIEQFIDLAQGFDMFSVNLYPTENALSSVFNFGDKSADYENARVVSTDSFSVFDGTIWSGELTTIQPGLAYQWDGSSTYTVDVTGTLASEAGQKISLRKGWNWIGANVSRSVELMTALSDVIPVSGDVVRDEYDYARYENGGWIGDLLYITPGEGYLYYNTDDPKEFSYPTNAALSNAKSESLQSKDFSQETSYLSKYSGVMTIVAAVENNGVRVGNVELTAYDTNGEVRGYKKSHDEDSRHLIYMVIHGDKSETISLASNSLSKNLQPKDFSTLPCGESGERGQEASGSTLTFEEGRGLGTPSNPYIIEIGGTGIQTMPEVNSEESKESKESKESYDLSGRKINDLDNYKHNKGVFIINGKKVVK